MKYISIIFWLLAIVSALIPGALTWLMLCSEHHTMGECLSRLSSFQLYLSKGPGVPARVSSYDSNPRLPSALFPSDLHQGRLNWGPDAPGSMKHSLDATINGLYFHHPLTSAQGDALISVMSDWNTFVGSLGEAARKGWATFLTARRRKYTYQVLFFTGQCPGLQPSM